MRDWTHLATKVKRRVERHQRRRRQKQLLVLTLVGMAIFITLFRTEPAPPIYDTPAFSAELEDGTTFVYFDLDARDE